MVNLNELKFFCGALLVALMIAVGATSIAEAFMSAESACNYKVHRLDYIFPVRPISCWLSEEP